MTKPATTTRWNRQAKAFEKRCSKCHQWLPADADHFTRSNATCDGLYHQCKPCKAVVAAAWRAKNPDYHKQWKAANPERVRELAAAYRENNRDRLREKSRLYHALRRDEHRSRLAAIYRADPEKYKARARRWAQENPDRVKHNKHRYYREIESQVSRVERESAGGMLGRDVQLGDGTLAKVAGKRGDMWLVRLYEPMKVGKDQWQRIIQVRHLTFVN